MADSFVIADDEVFFAAPFTYFWAPF